MCDVLFFFWVPTPSLGWNSSSRILSAREMGAFYRRHRELLNKLDIRQQYRADNAGFNHFLISASVALRFRCPVFESVRFRSYR
jgi:hypothetical protein